MAAMTFDGGHFVILSKGDRQLHTHLNIIIGGVKHEY